MPRLPRQNALSNKHSPELRQTGMHLGLRAVWLPALVDHGDSLECERCFHAYLFRLPSTRAFLAALHAQLVCTPNLSW